MLNLFTCFNKCMILYVQLLGVSKIKYNLPGYLSILLYYVTFSILVCTVVSLTLFLLTDLFSLSVTNLSDSDLAYLSGKGFGRTYPSGKRPSRSVHFDIPEEDTSSLKNTSGLNFNSATPSVKSRYSKIRTGAVIEDIEAYVTKKALGSERRHFARAKRVNDSIECEIKLEENKKLLDAKLEAEASERVRQQAAEAERVRIQEARIQKAAEARQARIQEAAEAERARIQQIAEAGAAFRLKQAAKARELELDQAAEAREHRLQQAADAGAVRRFNLRSYLSKENTARHYFSGATNRSRANMHPKSKWPYDANNNYVYYNGSTKPSNIYDDTPAKVKISFNDMGEKEDPFIHKSAPGVEQPANDEDRGPNIPGDGDKTSLVEKLMGFVLHLVPHWIDLNTFQGKFLLSLFFSISFILIIFGIRYLYSRFIKPLFNKNSKDSNKLKNKKDTKL